MRIDFKNFYTQLDANSIADMQVSSETVCVIGHALCRSVILSGALSEIADAFQRKRGARREKERRRRVIEMKWITGPRSTPRVDGNTRLLRVTYHVMTSERVNGNAISDYFRCSDRHFRAKKRSRERERERAERSAKRKRRF